MSDHIDLSCRLQQELKSVFVKFPDQLKPQSYFFILTLSGRLVREENESLFDSYS